MSAQVASGPMVPASRTSSTQSSMDPNKPVPDLLNIMEDRRENNQLTLEQIQKFDNEEPYVPLHLAEFRVTSLMGDLKDMKDDHVKRMGIIQKSYEDLLRQNHKTATDMLDKARTKAAERIKAYRDQYQDAHKQMAAIKKTMDKQQRAHEKDKRAMEKDSDAIVRAKKDIEEDLRKKQAIFDDKFKEVLLLNEQLAGRDDKIAEIKDQYKDVDSTITKLQEDLDEAQAEVVKANQQLQIKVEEHQRLEDALKGTDAELVRLKANGGYVATGDNEKLIQELEQARATIPILEADKASLAMEITRLLGDGASSPEASAHLEVLKAQLADVDKDRRTQLEKFRKATEDIEKQAEAEKALALASQQALYDTMIKQMIKAGKNKEDEKQKQLEDNASNNAVSNAKREADEALRKKLAADAKKDDLEAKFKGADNRLNEVDDELRRKKKRLGVVEPERATKADELATLQAAVDEANSDRDRVSKYTEEQGRAQLAKFNLDWDQVNGPVVTQLLDICKHFNLQKAGQEDMLVVKAEFDKTKALSASPDLDVSGPAKVKSKELAAQFAAIKTDASTHKAAWNSQVDALGLKNEGEPLAKEKDFEELALAAEMWHEITRKMPTGSDDKIRGRNGAAIPPSLATMMTEFGLNPATVDEPTVAALEGIVDTYNKQRDLQNNMQTTKVKFDAFKADTKAADAERDNAKKELAVAKAEGHDAAEIEALQAKVEGFMKESEQKTKNAKVVYEEFTDIKNQALAAKGEWSKAVGDMGLNKNGHLFDKMADFELLTHIAAQYKDWQEAPPEAVESRNVDDDGLPHGPSDELKLQVKELTEEQGDLKDKIQDLEQERIVLVKDKEQYEDMKQMAALAAVAANKEADKAKNNLKRVAAENGDETAVAESDNPSAEEVDLTGGNVILLNEDIAEAHKELMEARFALAQAQKQAEVYREQIYEERRKHNADIDLLEARIRELEAEIALWKRKEVQWKVSAGTFYAKAGLGGVQSQSVVAHEATGPISDDEAAKKMTELKTRLASTQRDLEQAKDREREAIMKQRDIEEKLKAGDVEGALAASAATTDISSSSTAFVASSGSGGGNAEEEARLHSEVASLREEVSTQRNAKLAAESSLSAVKAQLATLESASSGSGKELQQKLVLVTGELGQAQGDLKAAGERYDAEVAAHEEDKKAIAKLEEVKAAIVAEKNALIARVAEMETQLTTRDEELVKKNNDLTSKIEQLAALEDELRAMRNTLAAKDVEMQEKIAAQEAATVAALAAAAAASAATLAEQEAEAKAKLDAATAAKDSAIAALDGEVKLKETALADASAKQGRIDELNHEVDTTNKRFNDISLKFVEEQERRKHFQQEYEAAKGKIRVYARVRPFIRLEKESTDPKALVKCVHPGPNAWTLLLNLPKNSVLENKIVDDWNPKTFDHIFLNGYNDQFGVGTDNGSQAEVFRECEGFAEMAFDGLNTCIFAYGQSGSGKTWTMRGSTTDPEQFGLKPRMIDHVFKMREKTKARYTSTISCSMFEIYNDEIQDIFERFEQVLKWEAENKKCYKCYDPSHSFNACANCSKCRLPGHTFSLCKAKQVGKFYLDRFEPPEKKLDVKVLGNQRVSIPGLQQRQCETFEDMQKLCDDAEMLRRVRATGLNDESSRSHLIFAIYIEKKEKNPKDKKNALPTYGKLSLCDLAGSEKVERTQMAADISAADRALMVQEGKRINASLSVLTSIFAALGAKLKAGEKRQLPRYRENLLTNCMQDSIGGNARTLMFVNVSPSSMNTEETKQTLSYGDLVQNITGTVATADVDTEQYLDRIAQLEEQVRKLQGGAEAPPE